nr:STAS domain-containing protein [uncultured Lichenicoccus sp.]
MAAVFRLPGSLELARADALHAELLARVAGEHDLVVDGSDVERVSSACLQVLVAACAGACARGRGFVLQSMSETLAAAVRDLELGDALNPRDQRMGSR